MARTAEQILRDYLGDQMLTLIKLTAELEKLREDMAASATAKEPVQPTNGLDHEPPAEFRTQ